MIDFIPTNLFGNVVGGLYTFTQWAAVLLWVGIVGWAIVFFKQHKHKLLLRELTDKNSVGYSYIVRCKEFTDKNGLTYWKTMNPFKPDVYPAPPAGMFTFTKGNAKFSEAFRLGKNIAYVNPDPKEKYYDKEIIVEAKDEHGKTITKKETVKVEDFYHKLDLFTDSQRINFMEGLKLAFRKQQTKWDKLMPFVNIGILVFVVIVMVIAFESYHEKPLEMADKVGSLQQSWADQQIEILDRWENIANNLNNVQEIE